MSYEGVGYLRYDIISMKKAMLYYKEAIKLSVTQEIIKPQQECKQKISSIETMLKSIQNKLNTVEIDKISPQDVIAVEISVSEIESYALSFYREKLPIQGFEIRDKNCIIFLNGKIAIEKFKNHIQQELEHFCDEQEFTVPIKSTLIKQQELQNIACDEQLPKQEALIEERIISQFEKFKTSQNDVIIQITTKGIERTDLEHYCQSQLSINSTDLEFDKSTCWITLNKENVEILRNKLSNHDGLGMTDHEVSSYWNQYSKQGMKELLKHLNGNRVSQEDAVLLHSQLLENELLFDNTQILGGNTILSTIDLF